MKADEDSDLQRIEGWGIHGSRQKYDRSSSISENATERSLSVFPSANDDKPGVKPKVYDCGSWTFAMVSSTNNTYQQFLAALERAKQTLAQAQKLIAESKRLEKICDELLDETRQHRKAASATR